MRILILGTGTPGLDVENLRAGSSEIITICQDNLLFDCGWFITTRLLQSSIRPWDVTHLFFTHLFHPDHTVDYPTFALGRMKSREKPHSLKVYGPEGTRKYSEALFNDRMIPDINLYDSWNVWRSMSVQDVDSGLVCETDKWNVSSCFINHIGAHGEPSLAYRIDSKEGSVAISGDVGPARRPHQTDLGYSPNADLIKLSKGVDVFIMDACTAHTNIEDLGKAAQESDAKRIILTHFGAMPFGLSFKDIKTKLRNYFDGGIIVGEELKTYDV